MKRGEIPLDGPFDLRLTLESGQSYLWWREDGASYGSTDADTRYLTTTRAGMTRPGTYPGPSRRRHGRLGVDVRCR